MEHEEVKEVIEDYLESKYPSPYVVGEISTFIDRADIVVYSKDIEGKPHSLHIQVECKKTKDDVADAIGQCLKYFTQWDSLLTYVAVPEDYKDLRKLETVLQFMKLPIGLMVVSNDHKVKVRKEAEGKNSVYMESAKW